MDLKVNDIVKVISSIYYIPEEVEVGMLLGEDPTIEYLEEGDELVIEEIDNDGIEFENGQSIPISLSSHLELVHG